MDDRSLDVCVIGMGALGTFYALALERSGRARVTAVVRSTLPIFTGSGVEVTSDGSEVRASSWKPYRAVSSCEEAADRKYDFVVCAFKALPDVTTTPQLLGSLLDCTHTFVLIQNGVGVHHDLRSATQPGVHIISCCAWINITRLDGGRRIAQTGSVAAHLACGLHKSQDEDGAAGERMLKTFCELVEAGGTQCVVSDDIETERWKKVLWNATFSTLCTVLRCSVENVLAGVMLPKTLPLVREIMAEILAVAAQAGTQVADLPDLNSVIEVLLNMYSDTRKNGAKNSSFKPSMLIDLEAGRPMEVEPIIGAIVQMAGQSGIAVPRLETLYVQLSILQQGVLGGRAAHVDSS